MSRPVVGPWVCVREQNVFEKVENNIAFVVARICRGEGEVSIPTIREQ